MPAISIRPGLHASVGSITGKDWRWPHFTAEELSCQCRRHCHGEYWHELAFLDALESLRAAVGPLHINSARRCKRHNASVGGARASMHTRAIAADISLSDHDRAALYAAAVRAGFKGLGFGRTFIHVDIGVRRRWTYPGALPVWIKALGFDPTRR